MAAGDGERLLRPGDGVARAIVPGSRRLGHRWASPLHARQQRVRPISYAAPAGSSRRRSRSVGASRPAAPARLAARGGSGNLHSGAGVALPHEAIVAIIDGALLYIVGGVVYTLRRPDPFPRAFGYHEVFHLLVIAGSVVFGNFLHCLDGLVHAGWVTVKTDQEVLLSIQLEH
jgi:Haemolysin-III related